ncbi:MAG: HesA/MoeB/ThiF family protein [Muribaculaceae bacterium]|nr:HesA/MoeB/ThiF family protein [Muribaculaceae bacterium]
MKDLYSGDRYRRYGRNLMLEEIGAEGQERLLSSRVTIVGCGALGTITAMYLAGSGVGTINLIDFDTIDISNLQRQIVYRETETGLKKCEILAERIISLNPDVKVIANDVLLSGKNGERLFEGSDIIVEGSDNPETKYLVNDICVSTGKPYVLAGISGYGGQVMTHIQESATYRDVFPEAAPKEGCTPCSEGGVLGPLPGIVGSIQAAEVIKFLTGKGDLLVNRLLTVDAFTMEFRTFLLER